MALCDTEGVKFVCAVMAWVSVLAPDAFAGPAVWQYLVKGCITDAKGEPASGTVVTLDLQGVKPATADAKGCYQIHDVPLGIHRVTLTRDGATVLTTRIELSGEKATVNADFQLKAHAQTLAAGLVLIDLQALSAAERRPDAPPPLPGVPGVASLTFHPSRVRGGDTAHAVARLSSPAPMQTTGCWRISTKWPVVRRGTGSSAATS